MRASTASVDPVEAGTEPRIPWHLAGTALVVIATIVFWELAARNVWIEPIILPSPADVGDALVELVGRSTFWTHVWVTTQEVLVGAGIASLVGVVIATICFRSARLRGIVYPYVILGQSFPKILLLPILAVLFEYGMGLTIALVVAGAFFPTFLNALRGFESAAPEGGKLLRSMGATPRQTFRMFLLPSAMPLVFTGFRHTMTTAFLLTIIGEFAGSQEGLGYLINAEAYALQTRYVYAAILAVSVLAGALYGAVAFAEWLLVTRKR